MGLHEPWKFFQSFFVCIHLFVQKLTHFLMETCISTSPMYALPVINTHGRVSATCFHDRKISYAALIYKSIRTVHFLY